MHSSRSLILSASLAAIVALAPNAGASAEEGAVVIADAAAGAAKPAPPAIGVATAEKRELVDSLSVTGTIVARQEAAVGTDVNGLIVQSLNVDQGDTVKKGDVLAVLDRSALDTQMAQMDASRAQAVASAAQVEAQIADAEVAVRQAKEGLGRASTLQRKGFTAQSALDDATNTVDSAQARLVSAQKALTASQAQLAVIDAQKKSVALQISKTEIRAPADGLVLSRNATLGAVVSGSGGALFRIAIDSDFELAADVAETDLPRLAKGMAVSVKLPGLREPLTGSVRLISPEVDQKSRLGSLRVALPKSEAARTGSFGRGVVEIARRDGIAVPASAVIYQEDKAFLQLVENARIKTVPVTLGTRSGELIEVVSGVKEGESVVARAGTFVADGDVVTPVRDDKTGAVTP